MKATRLTLGVGILLLLAVRSASAQKPSMAEGADEILVGSRDLHEVVQGVSLTLPARIFISLVGAGAGADLKARIAVDLSDLQDKIGPIVDSIELPKERCSHFGIDNLVAKLNEKRVDVRADTAILHLAGTIEIWTCAKNPVSCTRLDMVEKKTPFGTIRVPEVTVYECNPPINEPGLTQPFHGDLPLRLAVDAQGNVAVRPERPDVRLEGELGPLTETILDLLRLDLPARLQRELERRTGPGKLSLAIPESLKVFGPTLQEASFFDNCGSLAASLVASIHLDQNSLDEWSSGAFP